MKSSCWPRRSNPQIAARIIPKEIAARAEIAAAVELHLAGRTGGGVEVPSVAEVTKEFHAPL